MSDVKIKSDLIYYNGEKPSRFDINYVLEKDILTTKGVSEGDYTFVGVYVHKDTEKRHIITRARTDVSHSESRYPGKIRYLEFISKAMNEKELNIYLLNEKKIKEGQTYQDFLATNK